MAACDYLGFNIFFWNYQNYWNDLCKFDTPDISYDDFLTGMSMTYATVHPKQQLFNDYSTQLYNYCLSGSSSAHGHTDIYYWSGNTDGSTSNTGLTGTKVGIGTDSPSYLLDVAGSARVTASLYVSDISSDASYLQFWNNKMRIDAGGNISIGASATGNEKLTVTGNISASTSIFAPIISATTGIINGNLGVSGRTLLGTIDAAGASYSQDKILVAQSDGEIEYLTTAELKADIADADYWSANTDGSISPSGITTNVGVGTTSPRTKLDVHHDPTSLANNTGGGEVVTFGSNTSGMVAGKLYYLNGSGAWALTDADSVNTGSSQLLGIALGDAASKGVLLRGFFDVTTYLGPGSFNQGVPVYVSTAVGKIAITQPAGSTDFVRVVGYCTDVANVIYFNPDGTYIKIA